MRREKVFENTTHTHPRVIQHFFGHRTNTLTRSLHTCSSNSQKFNFTAHEKVNRQSRKKLNQLESSPLALPDDKKKVEEQEISDNETLMFVTIKRWHKSCKAAELWSSKSMTNSSTSQLNKKDEVKLDFYFSYIVSISDFPKGISQAFLLALFATFTSQISI